MIILKKILAKNCIGCPELENETCKGNEEGCMCLKCPRNLGECIIVRYCRETESPLYIERK